MHSSSFPFPRVAWGMIGALLVLSFWLDFTHVAQGGAIDLRNRITGVRLLLHDLDPYSYKWHEPEPPEYADPYNNPALPVSKTTATPALLLAHAPLAPLPYRLAQFLWFFAQWALLLGTAWLWLRLGANVNQRLLLMLFVTGFTYTAAWRLHAERGQAYVLLLFLFSVWLTATQRAKAPSFLTGMVAGGLMTLRPPFVLLIPFLALHRRGQLAGTALGLLLGIGLPLFWNGGIWSQYAFAMDVQSALYRQGIDPAPPPQAFPPRIEGVPTDVLANYVTIPYADYSIHALLRTMGLEPFPAWIPLLAITLAYAVWLGWGRTRPIELQLIGLAAWFFLIDLFLPAYRDSYNDVLIINVVALGLIGTGRVPWGVWACFLALPLGWAVLFFAPQHDALINLPSFFLTLGALLLLCHSQLSRTESGA